MRRTLFIVPIILSSFFSAGIAGDVDAKSVIDTVRGLFVVEKGAKNGTIWYVRPQSPRRYCMTEACDPKDGKGKAPCYLIDASRRDLDRIPRPGERARRVAKKFLGRILPDSVNEEEAWYVDPRSKKRYPVGVPDAEALRIMRSRAKRLTKKELASIPMGQGCAKTAAQQPVPQPKLPGIPFLAAITTPACESIEIQWEKVADAEAYQIFRDDVSLATVNVDTLLFHDTGLQGQRLYKYKVRSLNAAGASFFSSEEGVQPQRCVLPPSPSTQKAPSIPQATSVYIGSRCNELVYRWSSVVDAEWYEIYRNQVFFAKVGANTTVYSVIMTPRNTQYEFQVRAINAAGTSPLTPAKTSPPIVCGTPPPPVTHVVRRAPNAPSNVRATPLACTKVYLAWDDVQDEDVYEIFRDGQSLQKIAADTTAFTDVQVNERETHTYTIRAINAVGASPISSGKTITTDPCPMSTPIPPSSQPPQAPVFLGATEVNCNTFLIRWADVDGEDGYTIHRDGMVLQYTKPNVTMFTDTGLAPFVQYRYFVRAYNRYGDSLQSKELIFKTGGCTTVIPPPLPPPPPQQGTSSACALIGGTTCASGEVCPSSWADVQGDNRCCKTACQSYRIADRCNYNGICEPLELNSCGDCQCRGGIVCAGRCYAGLADDAECVNETLVHKMAQRPRHGGFYCADAPQCPATATCLLPGPCVANSYPTKITFQLPTQLEVGAWTPGTVTFLNTGLYPIAAHVYFETDGIDVEIALQSGGSFVRLPKDWDLTPFQPNAPVTYPIRARMQVKTDGITTTHQLKQATLELRYAPGASAGLIKRFYGTDRTSAQTCGTYAWNISGMCLHDIWYAGASCQAGNKCLGRIPTWYDVPITYRAKGTFPVLIITAGLNQTQQAQLTSQKILAYGNEVREFFQREAERIAGKPMVDFAITFGGQYSWTIPDPQFQFLQGQQTTRQYLESKLGYQLPQQQYPLIAVFMPKIRLQGAPIYAEPDGVYQTGQGVILINASSWASPARLLAHEFAHVFGCQDLFTWNGQVSMFHLCNERRANNLLCAPETVAPELRFFSRVTQAQTTLKYVRLDECAAEMGWGDSDNNGQLDVDDPNFRK